jgi:hypothetical protein
MKRHEIAAIIGAYSRQGVGAQVVPGGFIVSAGEYNDQGYEGVIQYRTIREARLDTGIDYTRAPDRASYRAQLHA